MAKGSRSIRWSEDLRKEIAEFAEREERTFTNAVEFLVRKGLLYEATRQELSERHTQEILDKMLDDNDGPGEERQAQ